MIHITLENYRGCAFARLDCNPIALVGGKNAAGKSSLAQGVGACLCGRLPVSGLPRNPGNLLVRAGTGSASIEVASADGVTRIVWPSGQGSAEGNAPSASEWASGLDSIVYLSARDRARTLSDVTHAEPTDADLKEALAQTPIGSRTAPAIWREIELRGWDGAHGTYKDRGAELKGQWRQVTGVQYGSRVAASWRPDLADLDEGELADELRRATAARDRAIAAEAVSASERERLEDEAKLLDERVKVSSDLVFAMRDAEKAYALARDRRASLPPGSMPHSVPCPYCHQPLTIEHDLSGDRLEKSTRLQIDDGELKKRRVAIADADGALSRAQDDLNVARRNVSNVRTLIEASEKAKERLANWPRAVERTVGSREADEMVASATRRLAECRAKIKADEIHSTTEAGEIIIGLLAGDGLRAQKLARVLDVFNRGMRELTDVANWGPVAVAADMSITYAGRPYALLSGSEQYRVRAVLQVAMAKLEGASLVVLDAADILDGPARQGLIVMLAKAAIPALVCMTFSRIEQMPNLDSTLGASYWIEGGVIDDSAARAA